MALASAGRVGISGGKCIDVDSGGRLVEFEGAEQVGVRPSHRRDSSEDAMARVEGGAGTAENPAINLFDKSIDQVMMSAWKKAPHTASCQPSKPWWKPVRSERQPALSMGRVSLASTTWPGCVPLSWRSHLPTSTRA